MAPATDFHYSPRALMTLKYRAGRLISTAFPRRSRNRADAPLAVNGGPPLRDPRIPWPGWPIHGNRERLAVLRCIEGGAWWYGPRVKKFEEDFAAFQGGRFCITCSTGTIALEIAMQALGVSPGDEVIVPAFTFIATASAVLRMGGKPVFVDVDESWCMNPDEVERAITPKTKVIIPVHFAGRVADMDRLQDIAGRHGLEIFEDACHSWGSRWKGKGTGALGTAGAFSFQMHKNLTAAEGGAVVTDDEQVADKVRSIVNCGRVKDRPWYHHPEMGTNARLTEYQAALLSAQLSRLEAQTRLREKNAAILDEGFVGIEGVTPQKNDTRITRRGYHMYPFRLDEKAFGCNRKRFVEACQAEGLPINDMYYPEPLYRQPLFANLPGYDRYHCPVTEDLCWHSALWLNHWLLLGTEQDMHDIVAIVKKVKKHAREL